MAQSETLLELIGVGKRYEALGQQTPPPVLHDINLEVTTGQSVAVTGPSGSGKSTLLNLIGGLDQPSEGKVMLGERDLATLDDKALARVRNQEVGFIFQLHHLLPQCTVLENVLIPTLAGGDGAAGAPERAVELLKRVGLEDRMGHRPGEISGGERQRAAVVRALINRPRLLLADEPTGALDRGSSESLTELLVKLNRQEGVTMIVVTHAEDLAARMDRHYRLEAGRLALFEG